MNQVFDSSSLIYALLFLLDVTCPLIRKKSITLTPLIVSTAAYFSSHSVHERISSAGLLDFASLPLHLLDTMGQALAFMDYWRKSGDRGIKICDCTLGSFPLYHSPFI
jgi:hypothetical protein